MIIIVIINVRSFLEIHFFAGFQLTVLENKRTFAKKVAVHTTALMPCKARQILRAFFSTNQGNGLEMIFVAGTTKINLKSLKTYLCLDDLMQATI